ncbi:MAG: winged helix DNA-binding domain-containing protein [Rothia sp. (in: high G+C Gram-positive bacteria)]|nr:winged helix DNA-binding domain-containing protein [Rothia sp. (in: high G+C Gram-positive bacteria)]
MDPVQELQARRLIAQGLAFSAARPSLDSPVDVAQHLLALQGQTYRAGVRAIALRCNNGAGMHDEEVHQAIASHHIVRGWPMRGTLHFMPVEDVRWLMQLCSPRIESGAARRRGALGFKEGDFETAQSALYTHLAQLPRGSGLERKDAYRVFEKAGVNPEQGRGPHLLRALGGLGEVVQGALAGNAETFWHVDSLPHTQRELSGDEALAELGTRYINGHGPVTIKDLAWWAYLTQRDCRKAFDMAQNVSTMELGGEQYWVPTWQENVSETELQDALAGTYELPAFDEYLLGYADKSFAMTDELRAEVLTKNGISWDFTVAGGKVVGRTAYLRAK